MTTLTLASKKPKLDELKQKLSAFLPTENESIPFSLVPHGIPKGVICEVMGSARTAWVLKFLSENLNLNTFWAEEELSVLPTALYQRGVNLNQVVFAETGKLLFQSIRRALKSNLFQCLVLPGNIRDTKMLKAIQIFARDSQACVFFISDESKNTMQSFFQTSWAIPLQYQAIWSKSNNTILTKPIKTKTSRLGVNDDTQKVGL